MKKKWCAIGCVILGLLFFILSIFSDSFKGEKIDVGPSQITLLIISIIIISSSLSEIIFNKNPIRVIIHFLNNCLCRIEKFIIRIKMHFDKGHAPELINRIQNILFISAFLCYSIIYTLGRWNGNTPFIFLGSDASTIASFAAALDHPGYFVNDFILFPITNVQKYVSLHIPIIRILGKILNGYGNAFLFILPITIFLKLLGFYHLGKSIFHKPFYGFLLSLSTLPVIYTGVWDYWGLVGDALPRNFFEILFPWLILWSIQWIDKPRKWIFFSLILGGLTYVHPISSPVIFLSIWATLFLSSKISFKEKMRHFVMGIFIYAILIIPFVIAYYQPTASGPQLGYEEGLQLMRMVYESHLDLTEITNSLIVQLFRSGLLAPFIISFIILLISWIKRTNRYALIIGGWIVGILCFTIGTTFIETQIEKSLRILPLQMFFIRGIRYLPPLFVIFIYMSFFRVSKILRKVPHPSITQVSLKIIFGLLLVAIFTLSSTNNVQGGYISKAIKCFQSGLIICQTSEEKDSLDIIQVTKELSNEGEVVLALPPLSVAFERSIRYEMLRPLGYTLPDVSRLQDPYRIKEVTEIMEPWVLLEHAPYEERLISYLELAEQMGVNWLIIQRKDFPNYQIENLNVTYSNSSYVLVSVGR